MTSYSISEAKKHLGRILRTLQPGLEVTITRQGRPCGRLTAVSGPTDEPEDLTQLPEAGPEDFREIRKTHGERLPAPAQPAPSWQPRWSFANTDTRAVQLAELLHNAREPELTILFRSRARGDYAEGRSDLDLLLIEQKPPDHAAAANAELSFRKARMKLYPGQNLGSDWIVRTPGDFAQRTRAANTVDAHALRDGRFIGQDAEHYASVARKRQMDREISWANRHLDFLKRADEENDARQGTQAYLAISHAVKSAINAAGEWCPDLHDVAMLLDLASQADLSWHYWTALDPEIYTQYGDSRKSIPPAMPITNRPEYRNHATSDVEAILSRVQELKRTWPASGDQGTSG